MDITELEKEAISITRTLSNSYSVACIGINKDGNVEVVRGDNNSVVIESIKKDIEPYIVAEYPERRGATRVFKGSWRYI